MEFLTNLLAHHGLGVVFVLSLLEGLALPVPAYPVLLISAALAPQYHYEVYDVFLLALAASVIADSVWFMAGRKYGLNIVGFLCKVSLTPDSCVRSTGQMFKRMGIATFSVTKFIPGLATMAIVLSAVSKIRLRSFYFFNTIGEMIYIGSGVLLGVMFQGTIDIVIRKLSEWGQLGLAVVAGAVAIFILAKWWRRYSFNRKLRMDRISVQELSEMMNAGLEPVILDVRLEETRALQGSIPKSIAVNMNDLSAVIKDVARDREIIVYCACPNEASAATVAKQLRKSGFKKIRPLLGGIDAWREAGLTIEIIAPDNAQDNTKKAA